MNPETIGVRSRKVFYVADPARSRPFCSSLCTFNETVDLGAMNAEKRPKGHSHLILLNKINALIGSEVSKRINEKIQHVRFSTRKATPGFSSLFIR